MAFLIEVSGQFALSEDEVWPDGDAPENATAEDVMAAMKLSGSVTHLMHDWNLSPLAISVSGPGGTVARWKR